MAPIGNNGPIYSATYSNVPVYELNVNGNHVMRRREDNWINATHILKVADLDKPARTRVLEKEVQLNTHEKVQGGYGKYQGTWIPLDKGIVVAEKYNVYQLLKPLFDFEPGDTSPPPAPKHTTAASSKPRAPRANANRKAANPAPLKRKEDVVEYYENTSDRLHENESPNASSEASESIIDESEYQTSKRRRREERDGISKEDQEHRIWADGLLDYFLLQLHDHSVPDFMPHIPDNAQLDRPVDSEGHTPLAWAAAMGDLDVVKDLLRRGADMTVTNIRGETPIVRAGLFSNCWERGVWEEMVTLLEGTLKTADLYGGTIFHHVAYTAHTGNRSQRARHYLEVLFHRLSETSSPQELINFLNRQDRSGDTAYHIAARNSHRCLKVFQAYGLSSGIPNDCGETVDQYLKVRANLRKKKERSGQEIIASSSPAPSNTAVISKLQDLSSPIKTSSAVINLPPANLKSSPSQGFISALKSIGSTHLVSFLQAGESELAEKDSLLTDLERAFERTTREVSVVRTRKFVLQANLDDEEELHSLRAEHDNYRDEALRLEEQLSHRKLHALVRQEENAVLSVTATTTRNGSPSPQPVDAQSDLSRRLQLAMQLNEEQRTRRKLVTEVVDAIADASMSDRGENYVKMIASLLNIPESEVTKVADELVTETAMQRVGDALEVDEDDEMEIDMV